MKIKYVSEALAHESYIYVIFFSVGTFGCLGPPPPPLPHTKKLAMLVLRTGIVLKEKRLGALVTVSSRLFQNLGLCTQKYLGQECFLIKEGHTHLNVVWDNYELFYYEGIFWSKTLGNLLLL